MHLPLSRCSLWERIWSTVFQVGRNAAVLLREANRYEAEGDEAQALEYLSRYVGLAPNDNDTYARYALLLDKLATAQRAKIQAFLVLEQALRRDPTRSDLRRTVVKSAMVMHRYLDAIVHLKILLKETPEAAKDPELLFLMARCQEEGGEYTGSGTSENGEKDKGASENYESSYTEAENQKVAGKHIGSYVYHAELLRKRLEKPAEADRVMARMLEKNPDSYQALLARGADLIVRNEVEGPGYILFALKLAPDEPSVLLAFADLALHRNNPNWIKEARPELERGVNQHPRDHRFRKELARLELQAGPERRPEALRNLQEARDLLPNEPDAIWLLADLFLDAGERDEAEKLLARLENEGAGQALHPVSPCPGRMQEGKTSQTPLFSWSEAARTLSECRSWLFRRTTCLGSATLDSITRNGNWTP